MDGALLDDDGSALETRGPQAPTFHATLAELMDGLNTRTALETKFNKTLNAIKTGKLQVHESMLLADGTIDFDEGGDPPAHEGKKKKSGRKAPGAGKAQSGGGRRGFGAAAVAVQYATGGSSARDEGDSKRTILPPVAKPKSSNRVVAGTLGDYIGFTSSDFETPYERQRRENEERFRALKAQLDESQAASEIRATRFRGQVSAAIDGPCYGHKTMFQKLQALKEDPGMYADLRTAVRSYKEENRARRNLMNANGRDPFQANKEMLQPLIRDQRRGLVSKSRREHQQEVLARRKRVRDRKFLERFMMLEHSAQRHNVAAQRVKGPQAQQQNPGPGTVSTPMEVLRAQGIAQWIVMTMAADWFVTAFAPVRQKKEAEATRKC